MRLHKEGLMANKLAMERAVIEKILQGQPILQESEPEVDKEPTASLPTTPKLNIVHTTKRPEPRVIFEPKPDKALDYLR